MYYAEFCPYGIHTISDDDTLMAFRTRNERDEMVERINAAHDECIGGMFRGGYYARGSTQV